MSDLNATALHAALLQLGITEQLETSEINTDLNVTIFNALWTGMYTVVYGGTMYAYLMRVSSRNYVVPIAVTVLYLCNLATFALQWQSTKVQFIDNGDSRDSVFLALYSTPVQIGIGINALTNVALILSDGLLIWRCFHVWNRSFRIIAILGFLLLTETALLLAQAIGFPIFYNGNPAKEVTFNAILSAGILMAASTTIITTALIAYKITSFLKTQQILSSRKFKRIIDIVVESGAISSLSLLTVGISAAIFGNSGVFTSQRIFGFNLWASSFALPLSGISTTLMVARVATLAADGTATSPTYLTGLHFRPQSTARTSTRTHEQITVNIAHNTASASADESDEVRSEKGDQSV